MPVAVAEANRMLDALVGRSTYTATPVYAKLHLADPGSAGTTSPAAETTRKVVSWNAASGPSISSSAALTWSSYPSGETPTHMSFWDAVTGGNFKGSAPLNASAVMLTGETLNIAAGAFTVTVSGANGATLASGEAAKLLDAWAGRTTYTANAAFCQQLHTGDPGTAGTTNIATETTRKTLTFGNAASAGAIADTAAVSWSAIAGPTAPTTQSLSHCSYWTALTAGTFLLRDAFETARAISSGDQIDHAVGGTALSIV